MNQVKRKPCKNHGRELWNVTHSMQAERLEILRFFKMFSNEAMAKWVKLEFNYLPEHVRHLINRFATPKAE